MVCVVTLGAGNQGLESHSGWPDYIGYFIKMHTDLFIYYTHPSYWILTLQDLSDLTHVQLPHTCACTLRYGHFLVFLSLISVSLDIPRMYFSKDKLRYCIPS